MKTLPQIQEEAREKFEKLLPCIEQGCGGDGIVPQLDREGNWEQAQCEYCYRVRFPLFSELKEAQVEAWHASREETLREAENDLLDSFNAAEPPTDRHPTPWITKNIIRLIAARFATLSTPTDRRDD